jgi:hypothetical protein
MQRVEHEDKDDDHDGMMKHHEKHELNEPGPFKYMIALQDEHSKHLNRINEHHDQQRRKGITYHLTMTLGNTDQLSRIVYVDFVRGKSKNGSKNLPADCSDDFPFSKVFNVTIINRTAGADINYNIGRGPNATSMFGLIKAGSERTFDSLYPAFENINLARVAGASTTSVVEIVLLT